VPGIDPERLQACLDVLAELDDLPTDHPDAVRVRQATAGVYKSVKIRRRREAREAVLGAFRPRAGCYTVSRT